MKDALLLHLDPDTAGGWWLATDHLGNGIGAPQHGPLAAAVQAAPGRPCTVLLPTERCLVLEVRAPTRDRGQLERALPALVEDRVTADVEGLLLVAGPIGEDGMTRVVAIERAALDSLLGRLGAAGLMVESVIPDALCLPARGVAVILAGGRFLLRTPQRVAAASAAVAELLLAQESIVQGFELGHAHDDAALAQSFATALAARGIAVEPRPQARHELERVLLRGAREARAHDLCQGRRAGREDRAARLRWRLPLALASAWLALALVAVALEAGGLLRERQRLADELAELLPRVAPEAVGQPDPLVYLERRGAGAAGGTGGVALAEVVSATEALRAVGDVELMAVDARSDVLELAMRAPDLAALERARAAVEQALARPVELRGANAVGGRAEGRLVAPGARP